MTRVVFDMPLSHCFCPLCNESHWRKIFVDDYARGGGQYLASCHTCDRKMVAKWRAKLRKKGRKK